MKKILFTVLLVIVTIGGTLAEEFWDIGSNSEYPTYLCEGEELICSAKYNKAVGFQVSTVRFWDGQVPSTYRCLGLELTDLW